jgi:hypothetical protein
VKVRKTEYTAIDNAVWGWFLEARTKNIPVSGKLIQEKALCISMSLGVDDFVASNGWLYKWMQRRNVHQSCLSGDRGEVSKETVDDWVKRLPILTEGYRPEDIYNADETGLYFRALPSKSMVVNGHDTAGVKIAKDRITVLLCASATGDKLKPLVIG